MHRVYVFVVLYIAEIHDVKLLRSGLLREMGLILRGSERFLRNERVSNVATGGVRVGLIRYLPAKTRASERFAP